MKTVMTFRRGAPMVIPEDVIEGAGVGDGEGVEVEVRPARLPNLAEVASKLKGREVTAEELAEIRRRGAELLESGPEKLFER